MSFFKNGKNKEGGSPAEVPTDKKAYSLFRQPAEGSTPPAESAPSLRIVRGQGAVEDITAKASDSGAVASSTENVGNSEPQAQQSASSSRGGLFSRAKNSAPAVQTNPEEPATRPLDVESEQTGQAAAAPAQEPPKGSGFLSRLKGGAGTPPAPQEPTFNPPPSASAPEVDEPEAETSSAATSTAQSSKAEAPAKKAKFLGLGNKPGKAPETKAEKPKKEKKQKPSKEPKEKKVRPSRGNSAREVHIYVQIEGTQRELFWSLRADSVEEVGRDAVQAAASFSREDVAVRTVKTLGFKAAQDVALQEIGEPVHLVNRSKDLGYVYATREERPLTAGFKLMPGQQALDRLLKRKKLQGKSLITGFTFKNAQGQEAVAILFHVDAEGVVSRPQVTLNPDRMEFVLNEFAKQRKLSRKENPTVLFDNSDFLAEYSGLQPYPVEPVWQGIPVSKLWRLAAMVTAIGAAGSCAWTAMGYVQEQMVSASIQQLTNKQDAEKAKASRLIADSLYSFSQSLSIDQDHIFDTAQQLWLPGTQLDVEAKLDRTLYHVKVPVVTNKTFNNKPSVDATPPKPQVEVALKVQAPTGCHKDTASVSGNMNEIEISVVCENRRSALSSFRND